MNWKERTVARILLLVARMLATGDLAEAIRKLSTDISVNSKEHKLNPDADLPKAQP